MRKSRIIGVIVLSGLAFFASLMKNDQTQAEDKPVSTDRPPVAAETMKVTLTDIFETVDVVGTLSPKFQTDVRAEYNGVVKKVYVTEWVRVKKGDKLASLDTREPEFMVSKAKAAVEMEKANLLQTRVAVQRAEREYDRILNLKSSGLATQQSVDEAGTEKEAAIARQSSVQAMLSAAEQEFEQAKVRFSKTVIASPIDGIVAERYISVGDLATDKPLFRVVDNRILDLTVTVPSKFIRFLKPELELRFTTDAFPGKSFAGKLMYINPVINETDRSVKVIAEVPNNPEVLKGGLFVEGQIIIGERKGVVTVPRNALLNWDVNTQKAELFLVDKGVAKRRMVSVGAASGEMMEISSGLSAGEEVICHGGFNIQEGDKVRKNGGK